MATSDRLQRASLCAFVTAFLAGIILLGFTISPVVSVAYFRTAMIVLVGSYAILVALIAAWYWTLKVCGR